jgi:radical SAM protein with 4Fe4S-binding SPASM domain
MILSFFNGDSLNKIEESVCNYFHLSSEIVRKKTKPLINNEEVLGNANGTFPRKTIIEYSSDLNKHSYTPTQFIYDNVDIRMDRLSAPLDIICNVTMKCTTNCLYCYADRNSHRKDVLPFEKLSKIIDEAKEMNVINFKIIGGDVFLYKNWEKLFSKMQSVGYRPCIATKIPIQEYQIEAIKKYEIDKNPIQISLDTMIKENLYKILRVNDPYFDLMHKTFDLLEKYDIKYRVNSVLSKYNDSIDDIKSLENFLIDRKNLIDWGINAAKCSMFLQSEYSTYKPSKEKIELIKKYLQENIDKKIYSFAVKPPIIPLNINSLSKEEKRKYFQNRGPCSANFSALYILPDGKVTICEELYWHSHFIIGDLNNQNLKEVWNSPKAKSLFYIKQNEFRKESPCSKCSEFSECRSFKHICWRDTVLVYGSENWDYPDQLCPHAPHINKDVFL